MTTTPLMRRKKSRLIVRTRDENVALGVEEIAFIYRDDSIIVVVDKQQKKYLCDKNLSQLECELDNSMFFRANRQYIINIGYTRSYKTYEKVKLEVFLKVPHPEHQIIVSQKTSPHFKRWMSEE
ncbi:MAG TPA: LytTR family DNA-binding domain-containing protein [Chitinophagaceae bacterium]